MDEEYRESVSLSYKWQYKTLDGVRFFGPPDRAVDWNSKADYPLRHLLWKTSRDAWHDLESWRLTEATVGICVEALRRELAASVIDVVGAELDDPESDFTQTLIQTRTLQLDSDEVILDCLDDEWIEDLIKLTNVKLEWDMLTAMLALVHVAEAVNLLGSGDVVMAGATTAKAMEWLLYGRFLRGKSVVKPWIESDQRRTLALSGADAAHAENRRLRQLAMEIYSHGTWKSKMQAARKISAEVHRTEMVVLRWIREHHKKEQD